MRRRRARYGGLRLRDLGREVDDIHRAHDTSRLRREQVSPEHPPDMAMRARPVDGLESCRAEP